MRPNHHQSRTDTAVQSPAAPQNCPTAHLSHSQTVEACSNTAILNVNGGNTSWKRILKYLHVASAPPQQAEILPLLPKTYPFQLPTFNLRHSEFNNVYVRSRYPLFQHDNDSLHTLVSRRHPTSCVISHVNVIDIS